MVFDFDDTLVPDSASLLFREIGGIDPGELWAKDARDLARRGYEPTHGWLKLLLDRVGDDKPLGNLTNADLRKFGASLEPRLFPGLKELPADLKKIGDDLRWRVDLYVVSGGLEDIIRGMPFSANFREIYGSLLDEGGTPPRLTNVRRAITFTEKTRYLFEIHKGIEASTTLEHPYAVNEVVDSDHRPVPLNCMIYVGDGLTDIPCFSLVADGEGFAYGIVDPTRKRSAATAFQQVLKARRTYTVGLPDYTPGSVIGWALRNTVQDICGGNSVGD